MVGFSDRDRDQLRQMLQDAAVKCSERCLYQSAKWASELLNSFAIPDVSPTDTEPDSQMSEGDPAQLRNPVPIAMTANVDPDEAVLEAQEAHKYLLAKSFFDCREYDRCASVFLPDNLPLGPIAASSSPPTTVKTPLQQKGKSKIVTPVIPDKLKIGGAASALPRLSQRSLFLSLYAKFMAGEKRKDEDSEMILGPVDGGATVNKEIVGISRRLETWFSARSELPGSGQGWLEYLYGIVLAKGKNETKAKEWLIRSVNAYPFNWGAWQELSNLLESTDDLSHIVPLLPQNIMTLIFHMYSNQELYQSNDAVHHQLSALDDIFPSSQFLKTQRALLYYHSREFEEAENIFSTLIHEDPYRIDSLDHYSNILYVMASRPKLAFLAQLATTTDKFRPETCCVVGNYYSLKSEHEKAVMYFRRALTLDRSFLSAWTLMGHEYVEMKNTHAAIESYRRAVDVNRKDYRAWYGLGQTYEVLEMHYYALFYYQRAASLKPYDPKMWQAVGSCFSKMDRPFDAVKAYKRALIAGSYWDQSSNSFSSVEAPVSNGIMDPELLYQIALMYEKMNNSTEAAAYMELVLAQEDGPSGDDEMAGQGVGVTATTSKARMWLARWEFSQGDQARAMELATELAQDGVEVEEAKALVRDIRARMEAERA